MSVILPVYNVEDYLGECLQSILRQSFKRLEVIAVDDGSTDGSSEILRDVEAKDSRLRVIRQRNAGLGAARNVGVARARGGLLTFVDSDDVLPPGAVKTMVEAMRSSDADIVMGGVTRLRDNKADLVPVWVRDLHSERRESPVADEPRMLRNFYTWNKLYRADFWRREGLRFREGVLFEDQPIITRALCRARSVVVLDEITYRWRIRQDNSSLTGGMYAHAAIEARARAVALTAQLLENDLVAPRAVIDGWLWTLAEHHFPNYIAATASFDESAPFDAVREMVRSVLDVGLLLRLQNVSASSRVLLWLALTRDKSTVADFIARGGRRPQEALLTRDGPSMCVALPFFKDTQVGVPDEAFAVSDDEQRLWTSIQRVEWMAETPVLRITARGGIAMAPPGDVAIEAAIVGTGGGDGMSVACRAVTSEGNVRAASTDAVTFQIEIDVEALAGYARLEAMRGHVAIRLRQGGVTRSGPLRGVGEHTYARELCGSAIGRGSQQVACLSWTALHGIVISIDERDVIAREMREGAEPHLVRLTLSSPRMQPTWLVVASGTQTREYTTRQLGGHDYEVDIDVAWLKPGARAYLHVVDDHGRRRTVYGPSGRGVRVGPFGVTRHTGLPGNSYLMLPTR